MKNCPRVECRRVSISMGAIYKAAYGTLSRRVHCLGCMDPLFKIQITQANKRRRDKTAIEFGESLMVYLGKKGDRQCWNTLVFRRV